MSIRMHRLTDETTGKTYEVSEGIFCQLLAGDVDDVVPPGGTVRVPPMLMDGQPFHRDADPRFAPVTDAMRQAIDVARDEYIHWVTNAWRNNNASPPPVVDSAPRRSTPVLQPQPHQPIRDEREIAYREMCERISNAWRAGR